MSRRDPEHDYRSRCIYHITITKLAGVPDFSQVEGVFDPAGKFLDGKIIYHPLGNLIRSHIFKLPELCPSLRIFRYVVMPDHIHFLLSAEQYLPEALGRYISRFKIKILQDARQYLHLNLPSSVFNEDFHDRILRPYQSLDVIYKYIATNPYRLMARRLNPDYFRRINSLTLVGRQWMAYGNMQLLSNPFKYNVIIHRADSEKIREAKRNRALYYAENGGVIVSPFFAEAEKNIRDLCINADSKIILLTNEAFPERYKPSGRWFELCEKGRLLVLAPPVTIPHCRRICLELNEAAKNISELQNRRPNP